MGVYLYSNEWLPWENTIAYLKLEENTTDYSWNSNDGTWTNITYTTLWTGKKVATFSGSSKVDFSSPLVSSGTFTCNMWVYGNWLGTSANNSWLNVVMGNASSDARGYYADHYWTWLRSVVNNVVTYGDDWKYANNEWFLFTSTYDWSNIRTYKNGVLLSTEWWATLWNTTNFYFGYRKYSNDRYWKGYMSEFICENVAWTTDQVLSHYNTTKSNYWIS